jgi:GNAT superfamily N-acetyltransferase
MNAAQFSKMRDRNIVAYADDMVRIGTWGQADAPERAREEVDRLLPGGLGSPGHHLMAILSDEGTDVGAVWFGVEPTPTGEAGFIHWLEVFAPYRRRGYAKAALAEVEEFLIEKGVRRLGVSLFSHATAAVALYEHSGYQPVSFNFEKRLAPPAHY